MQLVVTVHGIGARAATFEVLLPVFLGIVRHREVLPFSMNLRERPRGGSSLCLSAVSIVFELRTDVAKGGGSEVSHGGF